jgi:hypothetical protein
MAEQRTDTELLALFREPATKEKAFTEIVKKYQKGFMAYPQCW